MRFPSERIRSGWALIAALGAPGAIIGVLSLLSFGFSLIVLLDEYHHPDETSRAAFHEVFEGWVRSDDYLGYTLVDRVERWRAATGAERVRAERLVHRALDDLGTILARDDARFRLIRVEQLDLGSPGLPPVATWRPVPGASTEEGTDLPSVTRIVVAGPVGTALPAVNLRVTYRVADPIASATQSIEASYHRLVLALLGLSGYSLLCLGYMARHAQTQRERIAREAAAAATLELADRTCHELGNVAFVVANERRNLVGHIDLLERFVSQDAAALAEATQRAGISPEAASRLDRALRRAYADRGIDPEFELKGSAAIAREVCRQIATCSDYIALTVRELDGHLKRTRLPTQLESCCWAEMIADALALLTPKIEAAGIAIEVADSTSGAVAVRADRRLVIHALVNLLKNGIEATESSRSPGIRLTIETEAAIAWLSITDNGPGLDPGKLKRIFDPGYSTKAQGRGLGLAIVRESIAAQQGFMDASSQVGAGTTFRIGLPLESTVIVRSRE